MHPDQVRLTALKQIDCFLSAASLQNNESALFQQPEKNDTVFNAIVSNQQAIRGLTGHKAKHLTNRLFGMDRCPFSQFDWNIKRERSASSDLAADSDFTTQQ